LPRVVLHEGRRHHAAHNRAKALTLPSGLGTLSPCDCSTSAPPAALTTPPPTAQTAAVLTPFLQVIMDALQAGESVELRGFGRFQLRHRPPRAGRNPRTGETVHIPAKAVPTFTAGKAFQERVHPSPAAA